VVPGADTGAETLDEGRTQRGEHRWQSPVAVHGSVVECRRLAFQNPQEVERIEDLLAVLVAPRVRGERGAVADDLDAVDVALDTDGAECPPAWHAVAVAVELHRLILVHYGGPGHARIEPPGRERQRGGAIVLEERRH